jgi:hypothetical protein
MYIALHMPMCAVNIDMESYGGRNGFTMDKWINYPTA